MMRRLFALLLAFCLLLPAALAEEASLLTANTVEKVSQFLRLPQEGALAAAEAGTIRYICLNDKDRAFIPGAWRSDRFDLTVKSDARGNVYKADHNNMHSRAVYCMALSYLGVDVTPAMMSDLMNSRDITAPFDGVTRQLDARLERVQPKAYVFDTMIENYLSDPSYSPVFMQIRKPNGAMYTVLVVGYIPETGGFIIVDPAAPRLSGQPQYTYKMALHVMRQVVLSSAFYDAFYASQVVNLYQWRLVDE